MGHPMGPGGRPPPHPPVGPRPPPSHRPPPHVHPAFHNYVHPMVMPPRVGFIHPRPRTFLIQNSNFFKLTPTPSAHV